MPTPEASGVKPSVLFTVDDDGIALLTVNRPEKLNTLNAEALDAIESCVQQADHDEAGE